jgi:L-threonylcarbamoyladenylate synthase
MNASLQTAVNLLRKGDIVAFPTETVYGLGADASNEQAVKKIFAAKGRPSFNPLIVHLLDISWAESIADIPHQAYPLIDHYWPGPLTIIAPLKKGAPIAPVVTAGLSTIGLRIPSHPIFRDLLSAYGKPIAAPSANTSNRLSCTTAEHVKKSLGNDIFTIEDPVSCAHGLESTIVDFSTPTPTLLRHGVISLEAIQQCIGSVALSSAVKKIKAPGQLKRHYAPTLSIRLNVEAPLAGEAFLNFGPIHPKETLNLSKTGDLEEAASHLFKMLHLLDVPTAYKGIAVAPIPNIGIGQAINDRLTRASTLKEDK